MLSLRQYYKKKVHNHTLNTKNPPKRKKNTFLTYFNQAGGKTYSIKRLRSNKNQSTKKQKKEKNA